MESQVTKLKTKLLDLKIEALGDVHQFHLRKSGKFSSLDFVLGFFLSVLSGQTSLRSWAEQISLCSGRLLSKQGLSYRLNNRLVSFSEGFLSHVLKEQLSDKAKPLYQSALFSSFSSVLIEDSTCLNLPTNLARFFPGAYSKKLRGPAATARIQLRYELKQEKYSCIAIESFRQNDQSYAYQIVQSLQPKELVLRDLGYFVLNSFRAIIDQGADVLSRYLFGVRLYLAHNHEPICLHKVLRRVENAGKTVWQEAVLVGKEQQLPIRLVAIRLPDPQVEQRIRKAKKNRNKKANHNQTYFDLLKWNIFLTSVSTQVWTAQQVAKAYTMRWRIEIIFKTWKKHLNLAQLFEQKQSMSYERVMIQINLLLCWIILFLMPWYRFFSTIAQQENTRNLSIGKFAQWTKIRFPDLLAAEKLSDFWPTVKHYCLEEARVKRKSQLQFLLDNCLLA